MQLLYCLFRDHNLLPGDYYRLPEGERIIIRAFYEKERGV